MGKCAEFSLRRKVALGGFPGGPMVKTSPASAGGAGSIPGQGVKIPQASWPKNQNIKHKQCCDKFNKDFKTGPFKKKKTLRKENWLSCFMGW